jgi:hypothetical protein
MENVGIWIDKKNAFLIFLKADTSILKEVISEIEDYHPHGGSGSKMKGGPQDVVQDDTYLEREKNQLNNYFKEVASLLSTAKNIVIFGPSLVPEKLQQELKERFPEIGKHVLDVIKADSMTENQRIALVKNYFITHRIL